MLKLIKYEFIKNRVILLISLGFITLAELFLIVGVKLENETLALSSVVMFLIFSMLLFFLPLVIGILTYTKELSTKEGFLVYMTPNSTYKIIGAKFIFTLLLFIGYGGIFAGYVSADLAYASSKGCDLKEMLDSFGMLFEVFGLDFSEFVSGIVILISGVLLTFLMYAAIYYLVYTLTATFLQNNKGRMAISTVLFIVGLVLITKVKNAIPGISYFVEKGDVIAAEVIPAGILALGVIIVSWISCSFMLQKKINL